MRLTSNARLSGARNCPEILRLRLLQMVDMRGDRGHLEFDLALRRRAEKAVGNSSAMNPVESRPSRQRGCCIRVDRNGMLWRMPSMEGVERPRLRLIAVEPSARG